jgi:hypothetical protein
MTVTKSFPKSFGQFIPNGSTPKIAPSNNTLSTGGTTQLSTSSLRLRTDIELYVVAGGGTGDLNLSWVYETIVAVGAIAYRGGAQTSSATPLTDTTPPIVTGALGGWGQWEYLYPEVEVLDVNVPQLAVVTWRPKDKTIDTQFRRNQAGIDGIDLFMPWEIQDGSGLINTTDSNGNTYFLGARFAQSWLYEETFA